MMIKRGAKQLLINVLISGISVLLLLVSLEFILRAYCRLNNTGNEVSLIPEGKVSDKTFNIYYFGGSTMVGEPYNDSLSIPKLVSYMLDHKVLDKDIRHINTAACGQDFQDALEKLRSVLKKKDIYYPSLCVIYSGHNEFLRYHEVYGFASLRCNYNYAIELITKYSFLATAIVNRLIPKRYRLEIDERKFFDHPPYAISDNRGTIDRYGAEIAEAIKLLRKYNVPCIISTVAGNYSAFEPNRSVFRGNDKDKIEFKRLMDSGNKAQLRGMFAEAITYYLKALSLCDSFAETHYRLGKCYKMLGDHEKAWQEYQKAIDDDGMPVRATGAQNNFIKAIPEDNVIFTVDAVKYLRENAKDGIIGLNLMIDDAHPNLNGYILISQLIAEKIKQIFNETRQIRSLSEDEAKDKFSIDRAKMFEVHISRGRLFAKLSTWRYDPAERLDMAESHFSRAMAIDSSLYDPYFGLAICSFLRKNTSQAEKYLSQARAIGPEEVNENLKDFYIKQIIKRAYH
ncbi:MAG: tetratricopeptide repeat protein [Candidatus Omnitrophica bacterium]|nr:tetratricopeptide repeat protein [Candidatus Omnitrophota bacterium]